MKTLAAFLLFAGLAFGQAGDLCTNNNFACYEVNKTSSLSSATEKVTVQATSTSNLTRLQQADVYCSAECTVTFYQNGTAASTTSLTVTGPIGPLSASARPVAFSASNVSGGTTLKVFTLTGTGSFDLTAFSLGQNAGGNSNFSIGISSVTATVRIQIICAVQLQ